ncbi:MAG TPA: hypothetical protein ENG82_00450 [Bacteroidetes bacterium]|nr:hypothetical protein [Bacteroidota bacterium]HDZ11467.1 hypothetical protein [Bacteroidota bacterium]
MPQKKQKVFYIDVECFEVEHFFLIVYFGIRKLQFCS